MTSSEIVVDVSASISTSNEFKPNQNIVHNPFGLYNNIPSIMGGLSFHKCAIYILFASIVGVTQAEVETKIVYLSWYIRVSYISYSSFGKDSEYFSDLRRNITADDGLFTNFPKNGAPEHWGSQWQGTKQTSTITLDRLEPWGSSLLKVFVTITILFDVSNYHNIHHLMDKLSNVVSRPKRGSFLARPGVLSRQMYTQIKCNATTDEDGVKWPQSGGFDTTNVFCLNATSGKHFITRKCDNDGWGAPDASHCALPAATTTTAKPESTTPSSSDLLFTIVSSLEKILDTGKKLMDENELQAALSLLKSLISRISSFPPDDDLTSNILKTINLITQLDNRLDVLQLINLRNVIEAVARNRQLDETDDSYDFRGTRLSMRIVKLSQLTSVKYTVFEKIVSRGIISLKQRPQSTSKTKDVGLVLPLKENLKGLTIRKNSTEDRLAVYVFLSGKLFNSNSSSIQTSIFSVVIPVLENKILKENLTMMFAEKDSSIAEQRNKCVYWNPKSRFFIGSWVPDGCSLTHTNPAVCSCNHFSSFALMRIEGLSEEHKRRLSVISVVGCAISSMSLMLTLLTYSCFRQLRVDMPSKILICICGSLLMTNLLFITNLSLAHTFGPRAQNESGFYVGCRVMGMLLHYFLLVSLAWMGANGYYMYKALVDVFALYHNLLLKLAVFAFGGPILIVLITASSNFKDNYGLEADEICWLTKRSIFSGFYSPAGILSMFNFGVFIVVFLQIKRVSKSEMTTSVKSVAVQLKGCVSITILLGLTWSFGFLAVGAGEVVFAYFFVIFNSLQGFFIFIFYCILKESARFQWTRWYHRWRETDLLASTAATGKTRTKDLDLTSAVVTEDRIVSCLQEEEKQRRLPTSYVDLTTKTSTYIF